MKILKQTLDYLFIPYCNKITEHPHKLEASDELIAVISVLFAILAGWQKGKKNSYAANYNHKSHLVPLFGLN